MVGASVGSSLAIVIAAFRKMHGLSLGVSVGWMSNPSPTEKSESPIIRSCCWIHIGFVPLFLNFQARPYPCPCRSPSPFCHLITCPCPYSICHLITCPYSTIRALRFRLAYGSLHTTKNVVGMLTVLTPCVKPNEILQPSLRTETIDSVSFDKGHTVAFSQERGTLLHFLLQ